MVKVDDATQSAQCLKCEEFLEMRRSQHANPYSRLYALERFRESHAECEQFATVGLAKINRRVMKNMRREMSRLREARA